MYNNYNYSNYSNNNNNNAYNQYANNFNNMNMNANNNQYPSYNYNANPYANSGYEYQPYDSDAHSHASASMPNNTYSNIAANMYQYGSSVGTLNSNNNVYNNQAQNLNMSGSGSAQNLYSNSKKRGAFINNNNNNNNFNQHSMSHSSNNLYSKPLPPRPPPEAMPSNAPNFEKMRSNSSPNLNVKTKKMKFKLRIGSKIEVWSNSKQQWIDGTITKLKGKLVLCSYGQGKNEGKKWLEATSKDFRPKDSESLGLDQSNTNLSTFDSDYMNNPTAARFRKSVAFQQKESVKVKLRVGSLVEVFSVSKNKWIDGKLTGIKGKLIRVSYGPGFNTEKWLKSDSKQFRAKLDMVDSAYSGQQGNNGYSLATDDDQKKSVIDEDTFKYQAKREHYRDFALNAIKGSGKKRGDLVLRIHGALELRNNANFCKVNLAEHSLKTKKCSSSANPVWKEILTFANFRPKIGKTAKVILLNKKALTGEKVVASAEFEVPIVFGRQEKMTIDVMDKNGKPSGLVVLEQCINEV